MNWEAVQLRRRRRRGFFLVDVLIGLSIIGVLTTVLVITMRGTTRAEQRLADGRAAARAAERTLVRIEAGQPGVPTSEGTTVVVKKLEDQAGVRVWIRVDAAVNGRTAALMGLVPAATADEAVRIYGEAKP